MAGLPFHNPPLWMLRCCLQKKMMRGKSGNEDGKGGERRKEREKK